MRKNIKIAIIAVLILICIIVCIIAFCGRNNNADAGGFKVDDNVVMGDRETKSQEEIQDELNKQVEEGMINISMNTYPEFESGTASGNLLITNDKVNVYPQFVEIYLADSEELIYQSGLIPVGGRIDNAKLSVDLDKGKYDCIAYFNAVDEETQEIVGKAGAEIVITVNK